MHVANLLSFDDESVVDDFHAQIARAATGNVDVDVVVSRRLDEVTTQDGTECLKGKRIRWNRN